MGVVGGYVDSMVDYCFRYLGLSVESDFSVRSFQSPGIYKLTKALTLTPPLIMSVA